MTRAEELKQALLDASASESAALRHLLAANRTVAGFHRARIAVPKEALDNFLAEFDRHHAAVEKHFEASNAYCDAITKGAA